MTGEKIREVAIRYLKHLGEKNIFSCQCKDDWDPTYKPAALKHCAYMCQRIVEFADERRTEKAFRWLGFVQGVLWMCGEFTITELKGHNRPK
jgi:hypothetical protein